MNKILKHFYIEPEQVAKIEKEAKRLDALEKEDVSQAEVVRRAIDHYFKSKNGTQ